MGKSRNVPAASRSASKSATIAALDCFQPGSRKKSAPGLLDQPANVGLLTSGARSGQVSRIAIRPALLAGEAEESVGRRHNTFDFGTRLRLDQRDRVDGHRLVLDKVAGCSPTSKIISTA